MIAKKEVSSLQKLLQESNTEVRQLQKQLADMECDSHTEIVKLRLEVNYQKLQLNTTNISCTVWC